MRSSGASLCVVTRTRSTGTFGAEVLPESEFRGRTKRQSLRESPVHSGLRTEVKAQAHAVMAKNGILPVRKDMWGESGTAQSDSLELPYAFDYRLAVLRELVHTYDEEIDRLDRTIHSMCKDDPGYHAVQAIYGVGHCPGKRVMLPRAGAVPEVGWASGKCVVESICAV